jgi:mono/diheme cytochrome c family protein
MADAAVCHQIRSGGVNAAGCNNRCGRTGAERRERASPDAEQVERGRQIADRVCWICHVTGTNSEFSPILRVPGPDFHVTAARPDMTAASLTAFLHTAHRTEDKPYTMPDPGLNDEMIGAVVSYILSLKPHS